MLEFAFGLLRVLGQLILYRIMPKRGDILLYSGEGFVARMIKRVTNSRWSHTGWMISESEVLEADWTLGQEKGVHINELEKYEPDRRAFVRLDLPMAQIEVALALAREKIGQRYDFSLLSSLFGAYVVSLLMPWKKVRIRNSSRAWICSELVATPLWQACGFRFDPNVPVEEIVPGDIEDAVVAGRARFVE